MRLIRDQLHITLLGASHEAQIGVRIEGIPLGTRVDTAWVQGFLHARRPQGVGATKRVEQDDIRWVGLSAQGYVVGAVEGWLQNRSAKSRDYEAFVHIPRPSHADYPAYGRYPTVGGGPFSGRMTAPLCIAGGIALCELEKRGVRLSAGIDTVGTVCYHGNEFGENGWPKEAGIAEKMQAEIALACEQKDSVGGAVTLVAEGLPVGLGGPSAEGLESVLSSLLFAVPGVKGVSFGSGFALSTMRGSEANDPIAVRDGKIQTLTNHSGGLNGGLTNGMPLTVRVALRPTPSIGLPQISVNLQTMEEVELTVEGRHDACIVPRARFALLSAVAIGLWNEFLRQESTTAKKAPATTLESLRTDIDRIDDQLARLFSERMRLCGKVGVQKTIEGLPVVAPQREAEVLARQQAKLQAPYDQLYTSVAESIIGAGRQIQQAPYGLVGSQIGASFSPLIHREWGLVYMPIEVKEQDFDAWIRGVRLQGFNVTMPYKQTILPYLAEIDPLAERIGAVNTVVRTEKGYKGYNTDYYGLRASLAHYGISVCDRTVAICGSGGVSRTAQAVCKDLGAKEVLVLSRTPSKGTVSYEEVARYAHAEVLMNATPVGMAPDYEGCVIDLDKLPRLGAVVDLVYRPLKTSLILRAKQKGIRVIGGLFMLVAQAAESARIWGVQNVDEVAVYRKVRKQASNLVLVGMPSCGKSTLAAALAQRTGRKLVDVDGLIERDYGSPSALIREYGEGYFRAIENAVLEKVARSGGQVVATGGGSVLCPSMQRLAQSGKVVWITRPIEALSVDNRPISQASGVETLQKERYPLYREICDMQIDNINLEEAVLALESIDENISD